MLDNPLLHVPDHQTGVRRAVRGTGGKDVFRRAENLDELRASHQYILLRNLDLQAGVRLEDSLEDGLLRMGLPDRLWVFRDGGALQNDDSVPRGVNIHGGGTIAGVSNDEDISTQRH